MAAQLLRSQLHLKLELMHIETCFTAWNCRQNFDDSLEQLDESW